MEARRRRPRKANPSRKGERATMLEPVWPGAELTLQPGGVVVSGHALGEPGGGHGYTGSLSRGSVCANTIGAAKSALAAANVAIEPRNRDFITLPSVGPRYRSGLLLQPPTSLRCAPRGDRSGREVRLPTAVVLGRRLCRCCLRRFHPNPKRPNLICLQSLLSPRVWECCGCWTLFCSVR